MSKLIGKKMRMTQMYKGDKVVPITPVQLVSGETGDFKAGDLVRVSGITKGKGFAGVVKRHGFHGGPATHGQKNRQRAPGSIGNTTPQRVLPGRRMAGHMGVVRATIKNLTLVELKPEEKMIWLRGAVPGNPGGRVEIYKK
ncbi:MAG: large subunit ribosomal protein L3 [Parcubacteria group bacterium Gr01-1014_3]|nr:MAG: large subunit ribosomal protein L3 [Parcubacteria group bacterium Gr01-1014_3]